MAPEILNIQPGELRFPFELKKQMACSIHLTNNTNNYVAFKVKTTSPKRYCVKPNTGIILPSSTCDFTVTMQAFRFAPEEQLRDKFLVQSTIVPFGTTDEDIVPGTFSKETGAYVEETKLKVILVNLTPSPELQPMNGTLKEEHAPELNSLEAPALNKEALDRMEKSIEEFDIHEKLNEELYGLEKSNGKFNGLEKSNGNGLEKSNRAEKLSGEFISMEKAYEQRNDAGKPNEESISMEKPIQGLKELDNSHQSHEMEDADGLKHKISDLESKLLEAEKMVATLRQQKDASVNERSKLKNELALLSRKCESRVQDRFPLLFVLFVALICTVLGYRVHS